MKTIVEEILKSTQEIGENIEKIKQALEEYIKNMPLTDK